MGLAVGIDVFLTWRTRNDGRDLDHPIAEPVVACAGWGSRGVPPAEGRSRAQPSGRSFPPLPVLPPMSSVPLVAGHPEGRAGKIRCAVRMADPADPSPGARTPGLRALRAGPSLRAGARPATAPTTRTGAAAVTSTPQHDRPRH